MGMRNSGCRPRPPRVRAVSMTTASPSKNQVGAEMPTPAIQPVSPSAR